MFYSIYFDISRLNVLLMNISEARLAELKQLIDTIWGAMENNLNQFHGKSFLNLETIRKNGHRVKTPVWFTLDGDVIYVRTVADSGKVKRVRSNGIVRIVSCDVNGNPTGEWIQAYAVEVTDDRIVDLVAGLLYEKYGEQRVRGSEAATIAQESGYAILKIRLGQP